MYLCFLDYVMELPLLWDLVNNTQKLESIVLRTPIYCNIFVANLISRKNNILEMSCWDIQVNIFHKLSDHCRVQRQSLTETNWLFMSSAGPSLFHISLIDGMLCWLRIKKQWVNIGCHSDCTWFRRSFQIVAALVKYWFFIILRQKKSGLSRRITNRCASELAN